MVLSGMLLNAAKIVLSWAFRMLPGLAAQCTPKTPRTRATVLMDLREVVRAVKVNTDPRGPQMLGSTGFITRKGVK